ncbi:MAG TPA: ABC transporter permease [Pyrinomonadaceae bacterium]|jgi:putative ABC transport system permease protein|nr:ABC transporter permease [Pyrinomonadaceae bacterium]
MKYLLQDIRFGLRLLSKNRTMTAITILAMALGIGASSSMFSLVNNIFLRPLPFKEPDRLAKLTETNPRLMIDQSEVTGPDFLEWRAQSRLFEHLAAVQLIGFSLQGINEPEQLSGAKVSPDFFKVLGVQPILGRGFLPEEEQLAASRVLVLSEQLWKRRFDSDPNVIGRAVTVSGESFTVVGVMPSEPLYPPGAEIWSPLLLDEEVTANRDHHYLHVYGRLRAGVEMTQAQAEMSTIAARLEQQYPVTNGGVGVNIFPLRDEVVGSSSFDVLVLFSAALAVLLISCASLGNLLLARAATREKEMTIRAALGGTRTRLVRQLLTESLLLAAIGGSLGLLLAFFGTDLFKTVLPWHVSTVIKVSVDRQVLAFTALVSVVTGVIFGLVPAMRASSLDLSGSLKEVRGVSASGFGLLRRNGRSLLVVSELALALVLLIAAGLLLKSFLTLREVEPGFEAKNVLSMGIYLPFSKYPEANQITNFFEQALRNIQAQPGVESAAVISTLPLGGVNHTTRFKVEGREEATGQGYEASLHRISVDYFKTMGIPVKAGRAFTESDIKSFPAVVISEETARRFWPGQDPVGKRVKPVLVGMPELPWITIIGVVGDVRHWGLDAPLQPEAYALFEHSSRPLMSVVVRTRTEPMGLLPAVSGRIHELDKDLPVQRPKTMERLLSDSVAQPRQYTVLIGTFAAVGLLLAALGIYGVMSYLVTQRTHEIGIRMALGARRGNVIKLVMGQGAMLAAAGVGIGLVGAFVLSRFMRNLLYGVDNLDPATFVVIPAVLAGVMMAACYLPARRATKIDPMTALRQD